MLKNTVNDKEGQTAYYIGKTKDLEEDHRNY